MEIKKSSNIYRLACYFGDRPRDFCHMCRCIIFNTIYLTVLCSMAGCFLGDLLASIMSYISSGTLFLTWSTALLLGLTVIFLAFSALILSDFIYRKLKKRKELSGEPNPQNEVLLVIKEFYKSKKDKFCPTIVLVNK